MTLATLDQPLRAGEDLSGAMRMSMLDVFAGGDKIKRRFRR